MTHEVDALFKRFSQLGMSGKITLKTKVYELAFSNTTLIFPLARKIKTKVAQNFEKPTKHEPSMWERVDEMNTVVGSCRNLLFGGRAR